MITKLEIDELVNQYETVDFIKDDPIQFPHRYSQNKKDCEISGFISSLLAYGNRKVFIEKLNQLFSLAQNEPYNFIMSFEPELLGEFNYRFGTTNDFIEIFKILRQLYEKDGGLEELFKYGYEKKEKCYINFQPITDYFYSKFSVISITDLKSLDFLVKSPISRESLATCVSNGIKSSDGSIKFHIPKSTGPFLTIHRKNIHIRFIAPPFLGSGIIKYAPCPAFSENLE